MKIFIIILIFFQTAFSQVTLADKVNPHGGNDCNFCHIENETPDKHNFYISSCDECHVQKDVEIAHKHPVSSVIETNSKIEVPANFPFTDNKFSCITCHKPNCKTDISNTNFLRKQPTQTDLDFCFECHKSSDYIQTNPHHQLNDNGTENSESCLLCHDDVPDKNSVVDIYLPEINNRCKRCHVMHHHEADHIDKDVSKYPLIFERFQHTLSYYNISMPLNEAKEIQCNTCHYTHERDIVNTNQALYESHNENDFFLRLPKVNICYACHKL